jgi:sporulation and cell division protein SsgA
MEQQHIPAGSATETIRVTVPFASGEAVPQELEGELLFDPADPYGVTMHVHPVLGPPVTWTFARELLAEGLYEPSGDGDVLVWPCLSSCGEAVVIIELRSPSGMAMLQTPSRAVAGFVTAVYACVPEGTESARLDLDGLVSHLLTS